MKILVTGFDPFGEDSINPALEAVQALPEQIADADIIKLEIPTAAYDSLDKIEKAIEQYDPEMILSVGLAGGASELRIERIGININDFRIKDNAGNQYIDEPIFEDGENAYFSNLPIKTMVSAIRNGNIPAVISNSAGTYVCNHVLYGVRYLIEHKYPGKKSGFIHVPYLPCQTVNKPNTPSMSLDVIVQGLVCAIEAMVSHDTDMKQEEGSIW